MEYINVYCTTPDCVFKNLKSFQKILIFTSSYKKKQKIPKNFSTEIIK